MMFPQLVVVLLVVTAIAIQGPSEVTRCFAAHVKQVLAARGLNGEAFGLQDAQLEGKDHLSLSALTKLPREAYQEVVTTWSH